MDEYIFWRQDGERWGLDIPSIEAFVENVLPKYFPEMKKWGSFQKQLNNYGFEKRDRSATQAWYAHWDNKFQSGRPDLLSQVQRRPETLPVVPQNHPPVQPPPATATMIPQSSSQPDLYAIINYLTKQLETTNLALKNMEARYSASEERIARLEADVQKLSRRRGPRSSGNALPNSQVHDGPAGGKVSRRPSINGAGHPSAVHQEFPTKSPIGAYNGGLSQGGPSQMGPGMHAINPAPLHRLPTVHPQLLDNASSAHPSRIPHRASWQPMGGVPNPVEFLIYNGFVGDLGQTFFNQNQGFGQQNAGSSAGPTPDNFATASTSQAQGRPRSSNSPGVSGPQRSGGTPPVPPMGPGMDTINPASLHRPPTVHPQFPDHASSAHPSRITHPASGQPMGVEIFIHDGFVGDIGQTFFNQNQGFGQQNASFSAGPTPDNFATASTSQAQGRPRSSNSPGVSGPQRSGGTFLVPPKQAPPGPRWF
ncbi:hypothetical protein FRC04_003052 [Tulasnella sp. 424]|nr:hypothetical protein FRC04_003052 [Tulasnella sp. 424]